MSQPTDTVPVETAVKTVLSTASTVALRPRFEGSNIGTWIGFKHDNYLVEEAVLDHFRSAGISSRHLYEEYGLGLDVVELDTRILSAINLDDLVRAEVVPSARPADELTFRVALWVERGGAPVRAVTSTARVVLRVDHTFPRTEALPAELARWSVAAIGDGSPVDGEDPVTGEAVLERLTAGRNAFGWHKRIRYPYCHFTDRLQMSGYLRDLEEIVDRFLADRGISIKTLLDEQRWIPAASHSRVRLLTEAAMEEELYLVYEVREIFKDFLYRSGFDTYVVRDGRLVHTATGEITHGYAAIGDRRDWGLVTFDERVMRALRGDPTVRL